MLRTGILTLALSAALLPIGCWRTSSSAPGTTPQTPKANDKIRDAGDAAAEAARAKRDEYAREMQKQLDAIDAKYKALEQRAAEAKGDAKKDLDEKVKVAKDTRDAAAKSLDELKSAGADRWEKVKDGVGDAFDDLKKIFE